MRKIKLIPALLALSCCFALAVSAAEFDKTISVSGGSSQRLSTLLTTAGYAGSYNLRTLTICNPSTSANTLYIGDTSTDTTSGFPVEAGACYTYPPLPSGDAYPATGFWLYTATTQNAGISAHSF
jgi:hypothetical protein